MNDWTASPLYRVEEGAMSGDLEAVAELGRRYADKDHDGSTERYRNRIAVEWMRGYTGQPSRYGVGRGGNFAAGFRNAHWAGKRKRGELDSLKATEAQP